MASFDLVSDDPIMPESSIPESVEDIYSHVPINPLATFAASRQDLAFHDATRLIMQDRNYPIETKKTRVRYVGLL